MATIKRFEDLEVWQKAKVLAAKIYQLNFVEPILDRLQNERTKPKDRVVRLSTILQRDLKEAVDSITTEKFDELNFSTDEITRMIKSYILLKQK